MSHKKIDKIFFQNMDDMNFFISRKIISKNKAIRVFGSGVDINKFKPRVMNNKSNEIIFLMVARLVYQKGVMDFINSAKILEQKNKNVKFWLIGEQEHGINSIPLNTINNTVSKNILYLGFKDDLIKYYNLCDCVVLPSYYREGVPKTLLEASACGKPMITTDNIGCTDVVFDDYNGFLSKPKNHLDLLEKMEKFIKLSENKKKLFGDRSRQLSLKKYDVNIVVKEYITVINNIL